MSSSPVKTQDNTVLNQIVRTMEWNYHAVQLQQLVFVVKNRKLYCKFFVSSYIIISSFINPFSPVMVLKTDIK